MDRQLHIFSSIVNNGLIGLRQHFTVTTKIRIEMFNKFIIMITLKNKELILCLLSLDGNRLLNWPKLLRLYADGFYSIFVPESVPYIIPHMLQ